MTSGLTIRSLGLATIGYAVGSALSRIAALLLVPVYTGALSAEELGVFATLQMLATIATPIVTLGIGSALGVCYFAHSSETDRERVVATASAVIVIVAGLAAAIGMAGHGPIGLLVLRSDAYGYAVMMTLASIVTGAVSMPLALRLQFRRSIMRYIVISLLGAAFALVLGILLVAVAGRGIDGAIEAQLIAQLVGLVGFVCTSRGTKWLRLDLRMTRELLVQGLPLVPSFLFLLVLQQGGQFLLLQQHGMAALGAYSVSYSLGLSLSIVVAAFTTAWMPHFHSYAERPNDARAELGRPMMWYGVGFGALATLAFVWSRPVLCLLVAEGFPASPDVFGLTAAAQVLIGVFAVFLPPLYFARRVWVATVVQGVAALVSLVMAWYLISAWGDHGAAVAHVLGMLVTAAFMFAWIRLRPGTYIQIRYPWKRIFAAAGCYAVLSALASIDRSLPCAVEWLISISGTVLVIFAALCVLHPNDRRIVSGIAISALGRLRQSV